MSDCVRIAIDRVVLHGYPGIDRAGVLDALRRELARLVRQHGVAVTDEAGNGRVGRGDAGPSAPGATATSPTEPARLGQQIARAVHERISRP